MPLRKSHNYFSVAWSARPSKILLKEFQVTGATVQRQEVSQYPILSCFNSDFIIFKHTTAFRHAGVIDPSPLGGFGFHTPRLDTRIPGKTNFGYAVCKAYASYGRGAESAFLSSSREPGYESTVATTLAE